MTTYKITGTGHDDAGRFYETAEAPIGGVTVDEVDSTVTLHHNTPETSLEAVTRDLLAIERDRLLGYAADELHMDPRSAVEMAWTVLVARGYDPDALIPPSEQTTLGLSIDD